MWRDDVPEPCNPAHGYRAGKKSDPRNANGHRRRKLRERVKSLGMPCALCGKPIDYSLPPMHPMSYELDEIVPVSRGGDPLDFDNVQATHRICNERKGAGRKSGPKGSPLPQSRDW